MRSGQQQSMKMKQRMTPQQYLLMQLIQLPVVSLEQRLKEEVEKNPVLEITDMPGDRIEPLPEPDREDSALTQDTDDDDYSYRERQERDRNQSAHERVYVSESSFMDSLQQQLSMKHLSPRQSLIAQELLGSLDDSGYVSRSLDLIANDLAFTQSIEVSTAEVEEALAVVQSLDPPGIGARNLQECLLLQLRRSEAADNTTEWAIGILEKEFDQFARHNYTKVMESLHLDEQQLQSAIDRIRSLNPKPGGGGTEQDHAHYIIPDFIVSRHDDQLYLSLNDGNMPRLQTSQYYQEMLQQLTASNRPTPSEKETIAFLREMTDNANMLVDTLQQRHVTMMRVMQVILKRQYRFFYTGDPSTLKPLLQREVAEKTGYDISTISRVVNSKYVQTEFGTFLLKDCFSQSIVNEEGEDIATEAVRSELRAAIDAEDKSNPLSDDALSQILRTKGYPVARRTVAKYRDMMGIPVGRLRRQIKVLVFMLLSVGSLYAQQPQKESYYDSLLNARIREGQAQQAMQNARGKGKDGKKTTKVSPARPALEIHEPEPDPNAIDSALATGDELIDVMYNSSLPAPSALWYGRNLSGAHVRLVTLSMDSLPDEISIRLLKDNEKFCFPVKNIITSPYGWRTRWNRPHRGVDIRLSTGEPVHCAFNGVVRIARSMGAYGNLVVVRHYNGLETVYGHLSKINVKPLQVVTAGQVLGLGGSTGRSTGPHLHFEVRFQYEPFDPEWLLDFSNYTLRTRRLYLDKTYFGIRKPRGGEDLVYKADKSIVPEETKPARPSKPVYATLRKGESIDDLAKRNYTTADKLRELNPDMSKKPKAGTKIRVR